ncbi:uncharacterized protein [Dermacentor andersoni]|uniref:uncharacterized protein n=1 Tax=Dermacentor andersoni TaxID=34620 RepID=UPI003B3A0B2A
MSASDRWFRRLRNRRVDEFFMILNPSQTVTNSEQNNVYPSGSGESTWRNQLDAASGSSLFSHVASESDQRERPSIEHDAVFCSSSSDSECLQEQMKQTNVHQEEQPEVDDVTPLSDQLQAWAIQYGCSHSSVTALLRILRGHECFSCLPRSARTLLETPRKSLNIVNIAGGRYCHFGIVQPLRELLEIAKDVPLELALNFHVDGLPLAKSSRKQFWTILCHVKKIEAHDPFVAGVFFGEKKPDDANEFLRQFVDEVKEIISSGIYFGAQVIPIRINAIICDAPARAFILSVRNHTGYYSCTKCTVKGLYSEGRVCFPAKSGNLRTNTTFRGQF